MVRFSEYMREWLYGKKGYYRCFRAIGKSGDFYTAVSTSAFFGAAIANELMRLIKEGCLSKRVMLIEIGAHQGYLLSDMIRWIYSNDASLFEQMRFGIIEPFEELQEVQRDYFEKIYGDAVELHHFSSIEEIGEDELFFVANEIFDAFPCELFYEGNIAYMENHKIAWKEADETSLALVSRYNLAKGEIASGYETFAKAMSKSAKRWHFITFDYGEAYVRNDFSIRIYHKHQTYPLFDDEIKLKDLFGKSDLTYDVNFAHLIDAYEDAGAKKIAYETQARALVRFGIIDILQRYGEQSSYADYLRETDKIKTLIAPTIMGDKFKMLHLSSA